MELPNNISAEKQVLANMLFSKDALIETMTKLRVSDFYFDPHKIIYDTLVKLFTHNKVKIEPVALIDQLAIDNNLDAIGGQVYILELEEEYIDLANSKYYINSVAEKSILRQLILNAKKIVENWQHDSAGNIVDYINKIEKDTLEITKKRKIEDFISISEALNAYTAKSESIRMGNVDFTGVQSGFPTIDRTTMGFHAGDLVILAARPSVGKTALALNFLLNACKTSNKACVMFSLEMGVDQLTNRLLACVSEVDIRSIQTASFKKNDEARVSQAIRELSKLKLFIDETPSIKVLDMRAKLQKLQASYGDIGLIVVDYIGLISPDFKSKKDNRSLELGEISGALKALAKDFKTPILVLSQLNRGVEVRKEKKEPMLSDLRESGAIEQDADIVMFIHRDDYQNQQKSDMSETKLSIKKHRNGALCDVDLMFVKNLGRFYELDLNNRSETEE